MEQKIRQPIVAVLGHVDHGKTTLLDKIRGTAVASREAGGITKHIGATEVPIESVKKMCGELMKQLKTKVTIPGLLFIDTPGHGAFTSIRKRGGALADIAVLVIDIMQGFQPQTLESVNILKAFKTPFLCALTKIDAVPLWHAYENSSFLSSFSKQSEKAKEELEKRLYEIVGKLYEQGFECERFDRITKFEKQVSLVPISAFTGEGIPELLMLLTGLAQRYLENELKTDIESPGVGTVLEVKEERGLGHTIDIILYDGIIKKGDKIIVGGKDKLVSTRVKALLRPKALDEIRDPKFKFNSAEICTAACGIKVVAPELENALPGSQIYVVAGDESEFIKKIEEEVNKVKISTEKIGVVLKADALGSLEGLITLLGSINVPIRFADIGEVTKRDVVEAKTVREKSPGLGVVLAFNVGISPSGREEAESSGVPIMRGNVIYKIIEEYQEYEKKSKEEKLEEFDRLIKPAKIRLMPNTVFRQSKPAIIGVEVLAGTIKPKYKLINAKGTEVGTIKEIQSRGEPLKEAKVKAQVAVSIEGPVVGRQITEGEILYSNMPESHLEVIEKKYLKLLSKDELAALEEIKKIKG